MPQQAIFLTTIVLVKYNNGIPEGSRYKTNKDDDNYKGKEQYLNSPEGQREIQIVKDLTVIAETGLSFSHLPISI